jgi:hypothetical protein
MSLEIVPPPEKRPSPFSQRRVKSYDEAAAEMQGQGHDYDRHRITQFIRQPFSTNAAGEDDGLSATVDSRGLGGGGAGIIRSGLRGKGVDKLLGRQRNSLPVSVRYNDTGSFEEVDEEKVSALALEV